MSQPTPKDHARQTASPAELLASLEDTPLEQHPEVFTAIHERLTDTLSRGEQER
ncbi:hypothetical protein [Bowdeniella nasicola]|uniref:hypothetical protein n=1 Tax=Bowdeniella nasicola TaxID=208480 RepID=UPI001300CAFE|nr:hypothetical protein [Bowdeniella nasicola]